MFSLPVIVTLLGLTWTPVSALPCPETSPSQPPPSSVNSVQPSDVAVISSIGLHAHSSELSNVVSRLHELMTLFNPAVISPTLDNINLYSPESVQHRTLVEQAKDISLHLQNNQATEREWKLVLLFVQVDQLCACDEQQVKSVIQATVQEVDRALQVLHSQLKQTIVSVALWDGEYDTYQNKRMNCLYFQLQPTSGQHDTEDSGMIIAVPCPSQDRPFLRTEGNSPSYRHSEASPLIHPTTGTEMPCEDLRPSNSSPTSVHALRPGDIKVVAAVGDSLTAGNGVASNPNNLLDVLRQYRGLSWSIGGDENLTTVSTLPNILKHFNPALTGYSVGMGKQDTHQAFLNQAVAGDKGRDMPEQVRALVQRMKKDSRVNFETDWKVITMFVGGNDVCDHCYNSLYYSIENYVRHVREALDFLHKEVPRALVNLVEPLHIIPLRKMHEDRSLKCPTWLVNILCPCVILPKPGSKALHKVEELNRGYQRSLNELVESKRYDTRPDFTVVVQPFFREIVVPTLPDGRPDRSYFSADCFHLSQKAQTLMARSLWNNMLEPLGNKTAQQNFSAEVTLKCPTETSPYVRTYQNSNYTYTDPAPTPGPITNWGSNFSCVDLAPSVSVPTSVHKLRPGDIKVVAALGDSYTAGTGAKAKNLLELKREYKGVSWSVGGDATLETVTTLPNILRKFNPSLQGFSKGQGLGQKGFNMAVPGAKTSDIPAQVQALITAMKANKKVDFDKDWKLVTIFIGGNDLCSYCVDQNNLSPKNYSHNLMLSLDMLYKELPRVLVNVVEIVQIDPLRTVKKNDLGCTLMQRANCPCVLTPEYNSPELEEIRRTNQEYQTGTQYLLSGNRYDGREDFTVVLQPFLRNSFVPYIGEGKVDLSFFSVDCFHISERGHAEMAIALWNNMLDPVGRKQAYNNFTYDRSKIRCPSETQPFIFTKINSLPSLPVTTTTAAPVLNTTTSSSPVPTAPVPKCPSTLPVWVPVVVAFGSLLGPDSSFVGIPRVFN
ncbi:phospholipase B1, membrane-associated-like [Polymixia lowei]